MAVTASNTQRAVAELRRLIFSGKLGPGSNHLETELAGLLGMSRTPVREAVLILAEKGLVLVRPRHGMRVVAISPKDMRDVYDVLTELESLAAERAARMAYSKHDLRLLRSSINEMDNALGAQDRDAWAVADENFHSELLRLAQNPRIEMVAALMEDQVRRAKAITLRMRPLPLQSNEDHRSVLEAIAAGKPTEARNRHHAHRRAARDMLVELLVNHNLKHL